jgi:HEAT repeat protein
MGDASRSSNRPTPPGRGDHSERTDASDERRAGQALESSLLDAMDDPDAAVRVSAVRRLAALARARGTQALMDAAVDDPSPSVRAEAVRALGELLVRRLGAEQTDPGGRPV